MKFIEVTIDRNRTLIGDICNCVSYPVSGRLRYYPTDKFTLIFEDGEKEELRCPEVSYTYKVSNAFCGESEYGKARIFLETVQQTTFPYKQPVFIGFNGYTSITKRNTHNRYTKDNDIEFSREVFNDIPRYLYNNSVPQIIPSIYNTALLTNLPISFNNPFANYNTHGYAPIIHIGCLEETYGRGHYCVAYDEHFVDETNLYYLIHWYFTEWLN